MRSYEEIARMTNTTVQQVQHAMRSAKKNSTGSVYDRWVICSAGQGKCEAVGATREQAVIDALTFFPNRF